MEEFEYLLGKIISEFAIKIGSPKKAKTEYAQKYNRAHDQCILKIKNLILERIKNSIW